MKFIAFSVYKPGQYKLKAACMPHNMHGTIAITKIIGKPVAETRAARCEIEGGQ